MIKICHITTVHQIDDVRIFVKQCTGLANKGFDVTLIACGDKAFEDIENGVKRISLYIPVKNRYQRMTKRTKAVYKKALEVNADLYHFHDPELLPIGLKLKKKGKKVIYDAHEDLPNDVLVKTWISKLLRPLLSILIKKVEHYYVRKIDGVVTVIEPIMRRLKFVNPNVIVCANYASIKEFGTEPLWTDRKKNICYVGGISKIRGIMQVFEAVKKTKVKLELAGNFSSRDLENELRKMAAWKNVNYHGVVKRNELMNIFNSCIAGVVTFIPMAHNQEASPNKIFEYMAAGLPVIASNLPYAEKVLLPSKSGICVDPKSPDEIADAIELLINNPIQAKKMGENARKAFKEKYNWEIEEKKLINLYNTTLTN